MNPDQQNDALTKGLRELAASSGRSASPELAVALTREFRSHHRRRRLVRRTIFTTALVVMVSLVALVESRTKQQAKPVQTAGQSSQAPPATASVAPVSPVPAATATTGRPKHAVRHSVRTTQGMVATSRADEYFALPAYDPAVPASELQVVRVELPRNSLQLAGVPVPQMMTERTVLADFVVRRDGTPYAVRFIQ